LIRRLGQAAEERRKLQPVQIEWVRGSIEWQAAMNKSS